MHISCLSYPDGDAEVIKLCVMWQLWQTLDPVKVKEANPEDNWDKLPLQRGCKLWDTESSWNQNKIPMCILAFYLMWTGWKDNTSCKTTTTYYQFLPREVSMSATLEDGTNAAILTMTAEALGKGPTESRLPRLCFYPRMLLTESLASGYADLT